MAMTEVPDWLTGVDREILDLMERSRSLKVGGLWFKPTHIAKNINRSRGTVNNHMSNLVENELVETDDRGWYRITDDGTDLLKKL